MKTLINSLALLFTLGLFTQNSFAHCEIPCGIYDDSTRVVLIYEHITTIEKSMKEITELSKSKTVDYNQMVRWVMNKEEHAKKIQDIVSEYFLHQRIKIKDVADEKAYAAYTNQLVLLHQLSVYAMKCKQTTDLSYVQKLRDTLHTFEHAYFDDHKH